MGTYTYPAPPAKVNGGDTLEIHHLLKTPGLIGRRVRTLLENRFIADALLTGRFEAVGGSILYETGESIFGEDDPESIAPGGAYPLTEQVMGELAAARVDKWGRDTPVTDEAITRLGINPVDRALTKLVNTTVRYVDSAAMGVIASKITNTYDTTSGTNAPGAWTTAKGLVGGVLKSIARIEALDEGFAADTIVLKDDQWATAMTILSDAGMLPREAGNPLVTGNWPETLGLRWLKSNHTPTSDPMLFDTTQLGGMADEKQNAPGYASAGGVGVETKSIRDDEHDRYKLRARRVTVPVVLEPSAGLRVVNAGL